MVKQGKVEMFKLTNNILVTDEGHEAGGPSNVAREDVV